MRIDPKYFNRFIGICAVITAIVIIYSTVRYFNRQISDFDQNALEVRADSLSFKSYVSADSLHLNELPQMPAVIHFWSTWSDKSQEVGEYLNRYTNEHDLIVIAAAVRDSDDKIQQFIAEQTNSFYFVEGTDLFQNLLTPGLPSQIFISREKQIVGTHVGNDTTEIKDQLDQIILGE